MNDPLQVRPVQQEDFARWKPLWDGYNAFYGRQGETALPDAITSMTWSRFFDGYEPMHALVAERGDQLLGLTHFIFHRSTTSLGPFCICRTCSRLKRPEEEEWGALSSKRSIDARPIQVAAGCIGTLIRLT